MQKCASRRYARFQQAARTLNAWMAWATVCAKIMKRLRSETWINKWDLFGQSVHALESRPVRVNKTADCWANEFAYLWYVLSSTVNQAQNLKHVLFITCVDFCSILVVAALNNTGSDPSGRSRCCWLGRQWNYLNNNASVTYFLFHITFQMHCFSNVSSSWCILSSTLLQSLIVTWGLTVASVRLVRSIPLSVHVGQSWQT